MHGILDLDVLCLPEILKFLNPLDLCSLRQSCTQLRDFVEDHFRSLYFTREQWLDLSGKNIRNIGNVSRILKNFGKLVRRLKVRGEMRGRHLLLDVILTNCGDVLKGLSLKYLDLYEIDMEKFAGVFDNLDFLELIYCDGDQKSFEQLLLGHQYLNLTTLIMESPLVGTEILKKFFMRKRSIKKFIINDMNVMNTSLRPTSGDILPVIVLNASEIEELSITPEDGRNMMSLVLLRQLKRLEIHSVGCDQRSIHQLIKELSRNNQLEMFSIDDFEFTDESCGALGNLTNLKELRLWWGRCTSNDTKSLEMLGRKLSKLESLTLVDCSDFPYRSFLASACKSNNFRTLYLWPSLRDSNCNFEQTVKDFIEGRGHRCFVSGDSLCIYLAEETFDRMKGLLTQENLQSIEKFGNIKILPANDNVFYKF